MLKKIRKMQQRSAEVAGRYAKVQAFYKNAKNMWKVIP